MIAALYFCFICIVTGVISEIQSSDIHEELKALKTVVIEQSRLLKGLQASVDVLYQKNEFLQNAYTIQKRELQTLKDSLRGKEIPLGSIPHNDPR